MQREDHATSDQQLDNEMVQHKVDVCAVQETKVREAGDTKLKGGRLYMIVRDRTMETPKRGGCVCQQAFRRVPQGHHETVR